MHPQPPHHVAHPPVAHRHAAHTHAPHTPAHALLLLAALLALAALTGCQAFPILAPARTPAPVTAAPLTVAPTAAPLTAPAAPVPTRTPVSAPTAARTAAPIVATAVAPTAAPAAAAPTRAIPPDATRATLVKVIDGDTIDVSIDGSTERGSTERGSTERGRTERVRYVGVDTPERGQPGYRAATEANRSLLQAAGALYLVRDVSDRDRTANPRLLRYVYLPDGRLVEAELVAGGWAQPVEYPPDIRFAAEFRLLAAQAAHTGRGFWSPTPPADGAMPYALTLRSTVVRRGPTAADAISETLPPDTPLTVYGRTANSDWLQVRTPTRKGGWIVARAVRLNVPPAQIPVR